MDELRGDGVYSCREKSYNSVLRETMIESEEKNSDWSLHSQGFKYLASYILNYQEKQEKEESKEKGLEWSELVEALSRVIEGTSSLQMGKSCFKLLEILLKKAKEGWSEKADNQRSI